MSEIREWEEGEEAAYVEVAELLFGESEHTPETVVNGVRQLLCEMDALRARCASLQAQVVAIAGHFNGWANGDSTAENALFAIGEVLGPPWTDTVMP